MHRTFRLAVLALVLLAGTGSAFGQYDPAFEGPYSKGMITAGLAWPCGPAVDTDNGGMFGGIVLGGGFNFMRRPAATIGVDGQLIYAVPTEIDEWNVEGSWTQLSAGLPMRIGRIVSFYFRPGLCLERLDSRLYGHESDGDYWEAKFDGSVALGLALGFGLDIAIANRISMGFNFQLSILPVSHEAETYWSDGVSHEHGTRTGLISICGVWRLGINI